MQSRLKKGFIAGFVATLVVSVVDFAADLIERMVGGEWFHSFATLSAAMAGQIFGSGANQIWVGWLIHFLAGTFLLGGLFAVLAPKLPTDTAATKGILFAVGAWVVMGLTVMPLSGLGIFGLAAGFGTMAWMLVIHVIFGVVLARTFARQHGDTGHLKRHLPIAE